MINLNEFVGKAVTIQIEDGRNIDGYISFTEGNFPYRFTSYDSKFLCHYNVNGFLWTNESPSPYNIRGICVKIQTEEQQLMRSTVTIEQELRQANNPQQRMRLMVEYLQSYLNTYPNCTDYENYSDHTFLMDILYGIGVALDPKENSFATGFVKWKEKLVDVIENNNHQIVDPKFPSLEDAQPGDFLEDGCIVVERYPRNILSNGSLLVAAPRTTEVECIWTPEFKPVFDRLKEKGFNPSDWFIPSIEQLQLAYRNAKKDFSYFWYWSSFETNDMNAYKVSMNTGYHYGVYKDAVCVARAFRKIEL